MKNTGNEKGLLKLFCIKSNSLKILHLKTWFIFFLSCCCAAFSNPPQTIPEELFDRFTLHREIPVLYDYYDNTYSSIAPLFYSKAEIDEQIAKV